MSLSAIALTALLTAQPLPPEPLAAHSLTSGTTPVGELYLRAPKVGSQAVKAKRAPINWARGSSKPKKTFGRKDFFLYPQGPNCRSALQKARGAAAEVQPLSKMPSAHLEFAVARLVDGCPVPVLMRAGETVR